MQAISPRSPVYELLSQEGREHEKTFSVRVVWENQVLGKGAGRSKKQAETAAALSALQEELWTKKPDHRALMILGGTTSLLSVVLKLGRDRADPSSVVEGLDFA